MAFATGLMLIDAPASALNNLGSIPGARTDNTVGVKMIRTKQGAYPYVSAQSFRYWLRTTLDAGECDWIPAPIYREEKVAYTDANPIEYWDDDLFGYMRAPSKRTSAKEKREADESRANETETTDTVTRVSPFRVSTLVSIAPTSVVDDFGTMSRHDGDAVPHEHQFYRATLQGLLSLDLHAAGTFSYRQKTGYRNLDDVRQELAEAQGLEHLEDEKSYRLPYDVRVKRISALLDGLAHLEGGAKQSLHYTDVSPELKIDALAEALTVFKEDILSDIYVGWVKGYLDDERAKFSKELDGETDLAAFKSRIRVSHPRNAFKAFVEDLQKMENTNWLD